MDKYEATVDGQKIVGVMVGRVASLSADDIQLQFDDGTVRWFKYRNVRKV